MVNSSSTPDPTSLLDKAVRWVYLIPSLCFALLSSLEKHNYAFNLPVIYPNMPLKAG